MNNNRIKISDKQTLEKAWFKIERIKFDYLLEDGTWQPQTRDIHDHGNGATVLLYNKKKKTIILTKQLRMATYVNGNKTGMMIEAPAGLLEGDSPEACIIREVEEETGYRIKKVKKIMESYMTPGAVTELLYLFIAEYDESMKVSEGGGVEEEHENIEVIELEFEKAKKMMKDGEIKDAKTILLIQYAQLHNLI
ncbi:NUDIX domain-containing protein [Abyssalbus ytuae]|uniref:GDP-mannose pyrophosphatase n=1 Tax=Abyssalbus ytuae TaxID=2926907 RepID=A0A9E6ZZY0_9FLAO|nr:NUDIX domain-containing protein [Abyssalbus ytuae]UOB17031.1 NUDIX domain-containing protein [Abyssalbus ytuae]